MHKFLAVLYRVVLMGVGFFIVFNLQFIAQELVTHTHDVMGPMGLWQRPLYYLLLRVAPPLIIPTLITDWFTLSFWVALAVSVVLPVLAIIGFERTHMKKSWWKVGLFYLFVPPALFLVVSYGMQIFAPHA